MQPNFIYKQLEKIVEHETARYQGHGRTLLPEGSFVNSASLLYSRRRYLWNYRLVFERENEHSPAPVIAFLSAEDFKDGLYRASQQHLEKLIAQIKQIPGFQLMSKGSVKRFLKSFTVLQANRGMVFESAKKQLHIILNGFFQFQKYSKVNQVTTQGRIVTTFTNLRTGKAGRGEGIQTGRDEMKQTMAKFIQSNYNDPAQAEGQQHEIGCKISIEDRKTMKNQIVHNRLNRDK